jgi:hypothetical protein
VPRLSRAARAGRRGRIAGVGDPPGPYFQDEDGRTHVLL